VAHVHAFHSLIRCSQLIHLSCSVACNRIHQDQHSDDPEPQEALQSQFTSFATLSKSNDYVDPYRILLDHSADFRTLFARYPALERRLGLIYEQTLPPKDNNQNGYQNGLPWTLGKGGQPPQKSEPWTREGGLRRAAAALRQARIDPSELGDGVREYCELVLHILAKQESRELTTMVREEVVQADTKVIQRLLREDEQ
jgi:zinc finger HIT domain-containing protein 3